VPKIARTFKQTEEVWAILDKYALDHKLDKTEALEQILNHLLSPQNSSEGNAASGASDLLPCKQRFVMIRGENIGSWECINPPTLFRKLKRTDVDAEICSLCQKIMKARQYNFPERTEIASPPTEETFDRGRQPVTDPTRTDMKTAGMVWCPEGMWVFPAKCDRCRAKNSGYWLNCQKQKLREKGEELRSSTTSKPS